MDSHRLHLDKESQGVALVNGSLPVIAVAARRAYPDSTREYP
jgi:hypothetical protein